MNSFQEIKLNPYIFKFGNFLPKPPTFTGQHVNVSINKNITIPKKQTPKVTFLIWELLGEKKYVTYFCASKYKSPLFSTNIVFPLLSSYFNLLDC